VGAALVIRLRLVALVVILLAPLAMLAPRQTALLPGLRDAVPRSVGPYTATSEETLDAEIAAQVRANEYALRDYAAPNLPGISLYVAFYGTLRALGAGAHDPRLCYPAQGWEVLHSEETRIRLADGSELRLDLMISQLESEQQIVLFWVQPASRWPADPGVEQVLGLADAVRGDDRYAFVRVSAVWTGRGSDDAFVRAFARELAPAIRTLLRADAGRGVARDERGS
jgi:EpsI family protein